MKRPNPRHEAFCRSFVEFANATNAAKVAGYAPASARNAGYRLLRRPQIKRRIVEMQREMAQEQCRDVDVLLGKLEAVYRRAVDDHHFAAAARAVEMQARLSGLSVSSRQPRNGAVGAAEEAAGGENLPRGDGAD